MKNLILCLSLLLNLALSYQVMEWKTGEDPVSFISKLFDESVAEFKAEEARKAELRKKLMETWVPPKRVEYSGSLGSFIHEVAQGLAWGELEQLKQKYEGKRIALSAPYTINKSEGDLKFTAWDNSNPLRKISCVVAEKHKEQYDRLGWNTIDGMNLEGEVHFVDEKVNDPEAWLHDKVILKNCSLR